MKVPNVHISRRIIPILSHVDSYVVREKASVCCNGWLISGFRQYTGFCFLRMNI